MIERSNFDADLIIFDDDIQSARPFLLLLYRLIKDISTSFNKLRIR